MEHEKDISQDLIPGTNRTSAVLGALRRVILATEVSSKELAKATGLTTSQLLVLQLLEGGAPNTITSLARHVNLLQATVTIIVDRLEEQGYVVRNRNELDRRKVHVSLTAAGRQVLNIAPNLLQSIFLKNYQQVPDWQQTLIIASLELVADLMRAGRTNAPPVYDVSAVPQATKAAAS